MRTITFRQMQFILILYILGSSLVMGGSMIAEQDSWIAILGGMVIAVPIYYIYGKLAILYPGKNFYEMLYQSLGNIGGFICSLVFTLYCLYLGAVVIRNFTEFIQTVTFLETPQFGMAIIMGLLAFMIIKIGIGILGRGAVLLGPITVFLVIIVSITMIGEMDIAHIKPLLSHGFSKILTCSMYSIAFPFGEVALFLVIMPNLPQNESPYKAYFSGLFVAGILLSISMVRNLLVLGLPTMEVLYFPSYSAVGFINIREFLNRIEVLVAGNFIISGLVKLTVCLYCVCKGLSRMFHAPNHRVFVSTSVALMVAISGWVFASTMEMIKNLDLLVITVPLLQIGLPLFILIVTLIKRHKEKQAPSTAQK